MFRILLVEDNPFNRKLAVALLTSWGHHVETADNGKIAVDRYDPVKYDLIFMDVQMPEMDGIEATQAIRELERHTGCHIPIFAMTGHAMQGNEDRCLKAGMDGYLTKPLRKDDIKATLAKVLK